MHGVSEHLIKVWKSLYRDCRNSKKKVSRPLTETYTVRQWCVLSPLLCITHFDNVCTDVNQGKESDIKELLFADDKALIGDSIDNLQEHLISLDQECKAHTMRISIDKQSHGNWKRKTKYKYNNINSIIKQVKEFKYLGAAFKGDGRIDS